MDEIIEKDISELQSKNKKFIISIKKTLLGVISATLIFSLVPNIEYQIALDKANNSTYIQEVLDTNQSKEEQIAQIFAEAIKKNKNIPDDIKDRVIEAFTTQVINKAGVFFTDKTIKNMYAVASTEKIEEMSSFAKEHGWWSGDYNPYTNTYSLYDSTQETNSSLIAHEQLHAILKNGFINTGLTNGFEGYGANEAITSIFGKNDYSYSDESNIINVLGMIIGYNNVFQYYVNSDLSGLKRELSQYLSPKETNQLIHNIDLEVFSEYFETFLTNNNISLNRERLVEMSHNRKVQNIALLKKIFENKYGVPIKESKLGQLIFNSAYFTDPNEFELDKIHYYFTYIDDKNVMINITTFSLDGIVSGIINKNMEQISLNENETAEDIIAKEYNLDGINGYSLRPLNNHQTSVTIQGIDLILNNDELESFDYEQALNDIIERIQITENRENDER